VLTPELVLGLRADSTAEEEAQPGSVVGINFDPFLASQDPCGRYEVGDVRAKQSNYEVNLHAVCSSQFKMPDVLLEVRRHGQSWQFVNFFYDSLDLRELLCQHAAEAAGKRAVSAELHCEASAKS
jgi:hypothetical protein